MEGMNELTNAWEGLPQQNRASWILSPDPYSSPVSELSVNLGNLNCNDSATPRRKLQMTPELRTPSPSLGRSEPQEMGTPTDKLTSDGTTGKRKGESYFTPRCSVSKMRRLRVKLSSRFASSAATREPDHAPRRKSWSPPSSHQRAAGMPDHLAFDIPDSAIYDRSLIGDFSKVASLLRGQHSNSVESYLIVDCRYPYEYQGGHIKGALNLHSEVQLQNTLFQDPITVLQRPPGGRFPTWPAATLPLPDADSTALASGVPDSPTANRLPSNGSTPRKLIIFHCEFSSQRGPQLCRYLRRLDRRLNVYPQLFYPEVYILEGGYKEFYFHYPDLCDPPEYVPMLHQDFKEQLCKFRKKTTARATWLRKNPIPRKPPSSLSKLCLSLNLFE